MRDRSWLREPLLHFLGLGVALFALYAWIGAGRSDAARAGEIVVSAGRVRSLAETFARQWNRPPTDDELAGLVHDFVREEVLSREAIALGLDRDDTIIRRRLAQKMEFLSDEVATVAEPTEDDLRGYLAAHPERFRVETRLTFDQVFLDRGKRGDSLERDAATMLAALNAPGVAPDVAERGDSRLLPARFDDVSRRDVEAQLGARFAARLDELPVGRFVGPIESGYGAHLVRVDQRTPASTPPLESVRDAVAREWSNAKRVEMKDAQLKALLARYRVTVEPVAPAPEHDRVAGTQ
jgi:hypothetical protein